MKPVSSDVAGITTEQSPYPAWVQYDHTIYVSGQVSFDDDGNVVGEGDPALQTEVALDRLARVLAAAGSDLDHVVSTTVYVTSASYAAEMNRVWRQKFGAHRPARATVVAGLLDERLLVEISATAVPVSDGDR
ncbi:RidA family protein [Mycolicibacterium mengxianglii]|uniref:RidA family protein n=1 Tax=Mycolicibacterium mengxianglii TaxID=2736649 RepID=UPI0018D02BF8|nr:RidA family protein [Mycolicibacterium mengxianglii]